MRADLPVYQSADKWKPVAASHASAQMFPPNRELSQLAAPRDPLEFTLQLALPQILDD
jgi:hypothetical protein